MPPGHAPYPGSQYRSLVCRARIAKLLWLSLLSTAGVTPCPSSVGRAAARERERMASRGANIVILCKVIVCMSHGGRGTRSDLLKYFLQTTSHSPPSLTHRSPSASGLRGTYPEPATPSTSASTCFAAQGARSRSDQEPGAILERPQPGENPRRRCSWRAIPDMHPAVNVKEAYDRQ